MSRIHLALCIFLLTACDATTQPPPESCDSQTDDLSPKTSTSITPTATATNLVAHEWGTFTAVAGPDGAAMPWRPLIGPSDLPSFVYHQDHPGLNRPAGGKGAMKGTVRMETPVIYFYTDRPVELAAMVEFPRGALTEWYPQAPHRNWGEINWGRFFIVPATADNLARLPQAGGKGHYFAARDTDAALVRTTTADGVQHEKFLFYRGVGQFDLSLAVQLKDQRLTLQRHGAHPLAAAIVFERRGERVGFAEADLASASAELPRPTLDDDVPAVIRRLEQLLVRDGLYEREATAMTATWRDHWFEDGLRVFYLLPRPEIDAILPLHLSPIPAELKRTIVGRIEIVTPELEASVRSELRVADRDALATCKALRARHGRFAEPTLHRLGHTTLPPAEGAMLRAVLKHIADDADPCAT